MKRLTLLLAVLAAVTALAATHQTKWESYADFDEFTGALSYGATTTLIEGGHATTLGVMCYKRDDVLNVDVSTEYTLRGRYASPRWNYQMNAPYLFDGRERGTAAFTVLDSRRGMRLAGPAAVKLAQKIGYPRPVSLAHRHPQQWLRAASLRFGWRARPHRQGAERVRREDAVSQLTSNTYRTGCRPVMIERRDGLQ